jgi:Ser/Thr protein kinase RdoA (MazF antagonist)
MCARRAERPPGAIRSPSGRASSFFALDPDTVLAAVEASGLRTNGQLLALNSYENRVYQIGLEESAPVIAKFYRPGRWSDAAIVEEHDFVRELADHEIPVVAPIADAQGGTLRKSGPFRYALYPRVGGRAPELDDPNQLEELGRLIGRVHGVGAIRAHRHRPRVDVERLAREPSQYIVAHAALPDPLRENYRAVAAALIERADAALDATGAVAQLRLHGDAHIGNVLVRDGHAALVDFDDTANGPAIQDLWMFLSGDRAYAERALKHLLAGYTTFRDFDPIELALVEPLRALRMLHYAAWLARRHDDPAFKLAFPWFGSERYWGEHVVSLREQIDAIEEPPLEWR